MRARRISRSFSGGILTPPHPDPSPRKAGRRGGKWTGQGTSGGRPARSISSCSEARPGPPTDFPAGSCSRWRWSSNSAAGERACVRGRESCSREGQVVPAVSLRATFRLRGRAARAPHAAARREQRRQDRRFACGRRPGVRRNWYRCGIQPPPEASRWDHADCYLQRIARLGERLILILDIDEVLNFTELKSPAPQSA